MKNRHQRQAAQLAKKVERRNIPSVKAIMKLGEIFPSRVIDLSIGLAFNPHSGMGSEESPSWTVVDVDTGEVLHRGLTRRQVEEMTRR